MFMQSATDRATPCDGRPELKSPVRVELEVHRQPSGEAAASPSGTAGVAAAPAAPLVMGIAGRTCEYCRQWLQDRAAGASAAASGAGGAAGAAIPPFVTHMYFSADGVPPLHAVMTDSYGERCSVPPDEALYLLLTFHSRLRHFLLPGEYECEFRLTTGAAAFCEIGLLACMLWRPLNRQSASIAPHLASSASLAGEPPYEAVLGLGKVWVNGRLVVDPPPAAYAPREGDAHPSGVDPASVRLAELRVAAMAAAIARGASKAEAVASGHAAVAAALAEGGAAVEAHGTSAAIAGGGAVADGGGGGAGAGGGDAGSSAP